MELDLDLLKKDWNNNDFKKYSQEELFQMTKKKSVSVAKWVFVIGILEILFWELFSFILSYYLDDENIPYTPVLDEIIYVLDIFAQLLPFVFIAVLLYLNYKIRTEETPKKLMNNIFMMKKSIHWYIRIFLGQIIFFMLLIIGYSILDSYQNDYLSGTRSLGVFLFSNVFALFLFAAIFIPFIFSLRWIYKKLIYGKMLRKLKENYDELSKLEA